MAYEFKPLRRQKVLWNSDNALNPLHYQLVRDGEKVTPTSATVNILKAGVTAALVTDAAMTLTGTMLTYEIDTTNTEVFTFGSDYRAEVTLDVDEEEIRRVIVFDVVRWILDPSLGMDQLIDLDDGIRGMEHAGDDAFAGLIEACRDDLQLKIEGKVLKDKRLLENAILDHGKVAVTLRHYVLHRIWFNKGNTDKADAYLDSFDAALEVLLASVRYDPDQSGEEAPAIEVLDEMRLVT